MITKQQIIDEVVSSGLTAGEIHEFSNRLLPMTQCHDLLRKQKMSIPTALLLQVYARSRSGIADYVAQPKKLPITTVDDIDRLDGKRIMVDHSDESTAPSIGTIDPIGAVNKHGAAVSKAIVELIMQDAPKGFQENASESDDTPKMIKSGSSFGQDGTYKVANGILKLNYNGSWWKLSLELADGEFLVDGDRHVLADFTEVK